jgi:Resolvase, N terminal domain
MAWAIDRLGRSLIDLLGTIQHLEACGVDLYLDQQHLDTTTPTGKLRPGSERVVPHRAWAQRPEPRPRIPPWPCLVFARDALTSYPLYLTGVPSPGQDGTLSAKPSPKRANTWVSLRAY